MIKHGQLEESGILLPLFENALLPRPLSLGECQSGTLTGHWERMA